MSHAKTQDLIEIVASAIGSTVAEHVVRLDEVDRVAREIAGRAVHALLGSGRMIVPREPTAEMLRAGALDVSPRMPPPGDLISEGVRFPTTRNPMVPVLISRNIWRAMVEAAGR